MTHTPTPRRHFLTSSFGASAGLAIGSACHGSWIETLARKGLGGERILVVIQLTGGNDGLNTIVPYRNDDYRKARPKLGISSDKVLKVRDDLGFHPAMTGMEKLVEAGRFSVIQGVGYAKPNRSHFESMDIWHTCNGKEERTGEGWIGRYIASQSEQPGDSIGLHLGSEQQPLALLARGVQVPSVGSIDQFRLKIAEGLATGGEAKTIIESDSADGEGLLGFMQTSTKAALTASEQLKQAIKGAEDQSEFPATGLGEKLRIVSRLILAGLKTKIFYVTLDGFDTHSQQTLAHEGLLRQWSEAVYAFVKRLDDRGEADRVLVMTFSEFGRRVAENASEGTDHGAAAPLFFCGPKLPKFEIGSLPSLKDLDDGDLRFHTDFRRVYATIIQNWFGKGESASILGNSFEPLACW